MSVCNRYTLTKKLKKIFETRGINLICKICIPEGTYILTNPQMKMVENVIKNDLILGKNGGNQRILETMDRRYNGELICIKGRGLLPFKITPEHPVFISTKHMLWDSKVLDIPRWKKAKDIISKTDIKTRTYKIDCLVFPKFKIEKEYTLKMEPCKRNKKFAIPQELPLNGDLAELLGLYLAEGFSSTEARPITEAKPEGYGGTIGVVNWSFGQHEKELVNRVCRLINKVFKKKPKPYNNTTATLIRVYSVQLSNFLKNNFGSNACNKHIPDFIMCGNKEIVARFIYGYWLGDGTTGHKKGVDIMCFGTSSPHIALQLQVLLSKLGIFGAVFESKKKPIEKIMGRIVNRHNTFGISFRGKQIKQFESFGVNTGLVTNSMSRKYEYYHEDENYFYLPIYKIWKEKYNGVVYNFETEDHTYQVSNVVVHNCECPIAVGDEIESKQQSKGKLKIYHSVCYDESHIDVAD